MLKDSILTINHRDIVLLYMNKKTLIVIVISAFIGVYFFYAIKGTAPIEVNNAPNWMPLADAEKKARETNKLILVDVYEVGCKYCREMEREIYPDSTVRAVLDAGYEWHAWTINDVPTAKRMAKRGIYSIITDRPKLIASGLGK